ncbi:hypothetical protein [Phycicoccus sp. HDW14]|uniref:hypothetical protein n=1 Tax=Phycicoccus sp. HDW14 TaxID=2714941 RepID=UPI001409A398|nr:hypothetical protein [Phycicoccus sp. HDW14]
MTTIGLDAIATEAGTFAVLAMDQRGTLRRMLDAVGRADTTDEEIIAFKRDKIASLAGSASAFLVDPTFGLPGRTPPRRPRASACCSPPSRPAAGRTRASPPSRSTPRRTRPGCATAAPTR